MYNPPRAIVAAQGRKGGMGNGSVAKSRTGSYVSIAAITLSCIIYAIAEVRISSRAAVRAKLTPAGGSVDAAVRVSFRIQVCRMSDNLSGLPTTQHKSACADDGKQSTISARSGQLCYILVCLSALFFGYIAVAHQPTYDFLTKREGVIDTLTFPVFLLAGIAVVAAALTERRLLPRCGYILGGIALLFFAGEESSWGQHIIGFATPDFMADLNHQEEFNIHNLNALYDVISPANQNVALFMLYLVACAAFFARKSRILGIPSPPILITLALFIGTSFDLNVLTLYGYRALFLLLLLVALLSRNAGLFIATATSLSISLCVYYVFNHHWSHHGIPLINSRELGEYLFSVCCLFYAMTALLDQRTARQKIAASVAAFKSATALPSIRIKAPPFPDIGRKSFVGSSGSALTPWTGICALIIAGSVGLTLMAHLHARADAAAFQETLLLTRTAGPAARSNFDVYTDGRDLRYFKQPCAYADLKSTFFLGVFPQNVDDLPVGQRQNGFANLDFEFGQYGGMQDGACAAKVRLPDYEIARISTGQYTSDDGVATNLWLAEFPVNEYRADAAAFQETLSLTRTIEPTARSNFDVYIDGRELHYFKQRCGYADIKSTFFLGVFPQNVDELPIGQRQNGFENLDFDFGQYGQMIDDACAAKVRLPGYEIARISTGQYTWDADGAPTNIWIAEFPVDK